MTEKIEQFQNLRKMDMFKVVLQIIIIFVSNYFVASRSCSKMPVYVDHQDGDVILAGLFNIHGKTASDECDTILNPQQLASAEAMVYAIKQVNQDPYLLPNKTLGYRIFDTCGMVTTANCLAYSFLTNNDKYEMFEDAEESTNRTIRPIAVVIGPSDSASAIIVANTLQVGNLPLISPSATSEELSHSNFKVFFRTVPPDSQQAKAISDLIDYFNWTYIAVIGIDTSYGRFGVHALEHETEERDTFCIHSIEYFPPKEYEHKIGRIVSRIKRAANVQVIVLWTDDISSIHFFFSESLKQQLIDRTWIAPNGWSETTSLFTEHYSTVIAGFIGTSLRYFNVSRFEEHLLEKNSSLSEIKDNIWWQEFWQSANNCSKIVWKGCADNNVSTMIPDLLKSMKAKALAYVIDAVRAAAHAIDSVYRCEQEQTTLSQVKCLTSKSIHSMDVLHALRNVYFQGITGSISFNNKGDSLLSAAYDIVNLQVVPRGTPSLHKVGTWERVLRKRLQLRAGSVVWKNGSKVIPTSLCSELCQPGMRRTTVVACCWECIPCSIGTISTSYGSENCTSCNFDETSTQNNTKCELLAYNNLTLKEVRGMILAVIAIIGILLTLFTLGVFLKHRNTPVVKSSIRDLSYAFLAIILLAFSTTLVHVNGVTLYFCFTDMLITTIVFNSCISILFLKTSYLVHVFNFQRAVTTGKSQTFFYNKKFQLVILVILNMIPAAIIIIFLVVTPPSIQEMIIPFQYKILQCQVTARNEHITQSIVYAYEFLLSIIVAYYAFKARKLPSNFSETRYIAFNMYIQLTVWAVTLATFSSLRPGSFKEIIDSILHLCRAYSFLLCTFSPKLFIILLHPEKNTSAFVKATVARKTLQQSLPNSLNEENLVSSGCKLGSKMETRLNGVVIGSCSPSMSYTSTPKIHRSGCRDFIRGTPLRQQIETELGSLAKQVTQSFSPRILQKNKVNSIHRDQSPEHIGSCQNAIRDANSCSNGFLIGTSKDIVPKDDSANCCMDTEETRL